VQTRGYISLLVLLLPQLTGGCATPYVIEKISPSKEDTYHYAPAYRDLTGNIILCVTDLWDGGYFVGGDELRFVFPVDAFSKGPAERPTLEMRNQPELPVYRIPKTGIGPPCPDRGSQEAASLLSVTVNSIGFGDISELRAANVSDDVLWTYFQGRAESDAIYVFQSRHGGDAPPRKRAVYVHEQPVFAGSRAVEIRAGPKEGNLLYVPLVPIAVAYDLVIGALFAVFALPVMAFS
jgi:hypothetical protein